MCSRVTQQHCAVCYVLMASRQLNIKHARCFVRVQVQTVCHNASHVASLIPVPVACDRGQTRRQGQRQGNNVDVRKGTNLAC